MDILVLLCILGITPAYKCEPTITPPPGKCEMYGTCTSEPRRKKERRGHRRR